MVLTSPVAWWSALAQAFHFIFLLIPDLDVLGADVPFVKSQSLCHAFFKKYKVPLNGPVPPDPNNFWSTYRTDPAPSGTQRTLMVSIYKSVYLHLKSRFKSPSPDFARIISVSEKSTGLWLTTLPFHPSLSINNSHFSVASRIRLGLPPTDGIDTCSCSAPLLTNPLHFLECQASRPLATARHDRLLHTLVRIARSVGIAVVVEPRLSVDDKSRTDGNFYLSSCSSQIDVSVVHPSAKSYRRAASKPLGAALGREKLKNNLYLERAQANGSKFYPVVFESYGAIGPRAREFIRLLNDEAGSHSIYNLYGLSVTNFILRSLAVVLQVSNSVLCLTASIKARKKRSEVNGH
jgi:hypothetical protein